MIKPVPSIKYYWEYIDWNGDYSDGAFDTRQEAEANASEAWADACEIDNHDAPNGTILGQDIEIVRFYYRDEDGARIEVERVNGYVEYEFYHGDVKEHGTWWQG